jgi:hypothetical protein
MNARDGSGLFNSCASSPASEPSEPDRDGSEGSEGAWLIFLPLHPGFATFSPVKALLQTGSSGRVPVPPEKRFLINVPSRRRLPNWRDGRSQS